MSPRRASPPQRVARRAAEGCHRGARSGRAAGGRQRGSVSRQDWLVDSWLSDLHTPCLYYSPRGVLRAQAARRACCTAAICSWQAGLLCGMSFTCARVGGYILTRRLSGYQRGCHWPMGGVRAAREGRKGLRKCGGMCVHTGTVGSSALFTGVSSPGRSGSGVAAGIFYFSRADDPRGTR